jgi:O-antigen/teichoic acid export membrane protein
VLQAAGNVLQYVTQAVLARLLGVAEFGMFTYATNWMRVGGTLSQLGGTDSALRFVPQYAAQGEWALLHGVAHSFRRRALLAGSVLFAVAAPILLVVRRGDHTSTVLVAALALTPVVAVIELDVSLVRGFNRIFRAFFPWLVLQPLVLIGVALAAPVLGPFHATHAIAATALSYVLALAIQEHWLGEGLAEHGGGGERREDRATWRHVTRPRFFSSVVYLVFSRADIVMVGLLLSPKKAGIYAVAMRVGSLGSIVQTAMSATVAPRISQLYWSERRDDLDGVIRAALRWSFLPTAAITVGLIVLAHPLLGIFGAGFGVAVPVLVVIALGQLVSVGAGPVGWLMNLTGQQHVTATVFAATAAVTMLGYVLLIPWLGMVGAAVANGGAVMVRNVVLNHLARRRLGIRVSLIRSLRP